MIQKVTAVKVLNCMGEALQTTIFLDENEAKLFSEKQKEVNNKAASMCVTKANRPEILPNRVVSTSMYVVQIDGLTYKLECAVGGEPKPIKID